MVSERETFSPFESCGSYLLFSDHVRKCFSTKSLWIWIAAIMFVHGVLGETVIPYSSAWKIFVFISLEQNQLIIDLVRPLIEVSQNEVFPNLYSCPVLNGQKPKGKHLICVTGGCRLTSTMSVAVAANLRDNSTYSTCSTCPGKYGSFNAIVDWVPILDLYHDCLMMSWTRFLFNTHVTHLQK